MLKEEFLNIKDVNDFVGYLSGIMEPNNRETSTNLEDYLKNYEWNGKNYAQTKDELDQLGKDLRESVDSKNWEKSSSISKKILRWGNVFNSGNETRLKKIEATKGDFFAELKKIWSEFDSEICVLDIPFHNKIGFTAGLTKVYSLLLDDFIIYDSRVAAALSFLVVKFCQSTGRDEIPDTLRFKQLPYRNQESNKRNPSFGNYTFKSGSEKSKLKSNVEASWIISQAINKSSKDAKKIWKSVRTLEAALFMMGDKIDY